MKKFFVKLLCLLAMFICVGCTNKGELNLNEIEERIDNLKGDTIDIQSIYPEEFDIYGELEFIYDFDFKEKIGLDPELIELDYKAFCNEELKELLIVVKPKDGELEQVKSQLKTFTDKYEALCFEEEGLLIYIASKDNAKVLEKIKECKTPIFGSLETIRIEDLQERFGINSENIDEILMKTPLMLVDSNTYIIVKPKRGKDNDVKKEFDNYMKSVEDQWSMYLPDQYELVKSRIETRIGDYLIYIVSNDNDRVLSEIKK